MSSSLSELPLNDYTASELVRLCLRHHDAGNGGDANSDVDDIDDVDADDEVVSDSFVIIFMHLTLVVRAPPYLRSSWCYMCRNCFFSYTLFFSFGELSLVGLA